MQLNFHELGADKEIAYRRSEEFVLPGMQASHSLQIIEFARVVRWYESKPVPSNDTFLRIQHTLYNYNSHSSC